ncbi:hypothetical protein MAR_019706 [Mya arenaria]|uniref:Uncharacterized protein n=1 Tax=Mya arenaria TaxID=6604 RepID=A0ABY7E5U5_MYAAR|nr:hypothetical protein MAR_019706 [Mya arenaria]
MARMEAIKTGRDVMCIVKMEEIINDNLSLEVIDVIRNHTYIQLPEEREHMDINNKLGTGFPFPVHVHQAKT